MGAGAAAPRASRAGAFRERSGGPEGPARPSPVGGSRRTSHTKRGSSLGNLHRRPGDGTRPAAQDRESGGEAPERAVGLGITRRRGDLTHKALRAFLAQLCSMLEQSRHSDTLGRDLQVHLDEPVPVVKCSLRPSRAMNSTLSRPFLSQLRAGPVALLLAFASIQVDRPPCHPPPGAGGPRACRACRAAPGGTALAADACIASPGRPGRATRARRERRFCRAQLSACLSREGRSLW